MSSPSNHLRDMTSASTRALGHVSNGTNGVFIASMVGLGLIIFFMVAILMISTCGEDAAPRRERIVRVVRRRRSSAQKKTGLQALTDKERHAVLERLFAGNPYGKVRASSTDVKNPPDLESPKQKNDVENETSDETDTVSSDASSHGDCHTSSHHVAVAIPSGAQEDSFEIDDTCAICLTEYTEGEMVLSGRSCRHRFHRECVIEWLEKHDDCPFCRKEMMTTHEFCKAAIETLPEERIAELGVNATTDSGATNNESESPPVESGEATMSESSPSQRHESNNNNNNNNTETGDEQTGRFYDY